MCGRDLHLGWERFTQWVTPSALEVPAQLAICVTSQETNSEEKKGGPRALNIGQQSVYFVHQACLVDLFPASTLEPQDFATMHG